MSGWHVDWSTGRHGRPIANVDYVGDILGAINERAVALGGPPYLTRDVGDDVQWFPVLGGSPAGGVQWWISAHLSDFAIAHDADGTPRSPGYYDGKSEIETYSTISDLLSRAFGEARTNWRRYETHPDEEGEDQSDWNYAGGIIDWWLYEDLQKALNCLIWTKPTAAWDRKGETNHAYGDGGDPNATQAKGEAQADFDASHSTTSSPPFCKGLWCYSDYYGEWICQLNRVASYIKAMPDNAVARAVELYAWGEAPAGGWHANGDWPGGYTPETWGLIHTEPAGTAPTIWSPRFGSIAEGAYPHVEQGWDTDHGYEADTYPAAVARWDVTGGFEFTAASMP